MDPKEHLKRKLESHMKSKNEILSPDFDPGEKSLDYWIGLHEGVEFGYKEGITIMEAAVLKEPLERKKPEPKKEHKAPSYIG